VASTVCLIGNGLSVSYSEELSVARLTHVLQQRFAELGGGDAEEALAAIAHDMGHDNPEAFELLLGPLESLSRAVWGLSGLTALAQQPGGEIAACGATLSEFARAVHRIGLAIVLGLIADHSVGVGGGQFDATVMRVCRTLVEECQPDEGPGDYLTIATLNYDGLLTSALKKLHDAGLCRLSDLGHGAFADHRHVSHGAASVDCWSLRTYDDMIGDTHLLHLHGSLGWLSDPETGETWKFDLQGLRAPAGWPDPYWGKLGEGLGTVVPRVVLTDQKQRAITEWPFSLAYSIFEQRLVDSDRWLIGGYGFGDRPINDALRRARQERARQDRPPPRVLLVGTSPGIVGQALASAGGTGYLVDADGFPDAMDGDAFEEWVAG